MAKNILLIAGGDSSEHEISLISSKYVEEQLLKNSDFNVLSCVLHNNQFLLEDNKVGYFTSKNNFVVVDKDNIQINYVIDCAVPCLHGFPGETGDIQSLLELHCVPYIGCKGEASLNCFNKVTTKLYLDAFNIENTPSIFIGDLTESSLKKSHEVFNKFGGDVYVKAASQGSSIGCYHVVEENELEKCLAEALKLSDLVLIEQTIEHRELEVAAYEYQGQLYVTEPGEIVIPKDKFYTFDEKYSSDSTSTTSVEVEGLSPLQRDVIASMAKRAFKGLNLRHLSRIDFFLATDGKIYINEINTFPGMTPISMFPKLVEHKGLKMSDFLKDCVYSAMNEQKYN